MDRRENRGGDEYERLLSDEEADDDDNDDGRQPPTDGRVADERGDDGGESHRGRRPVGTGQKVAYGLGHVFNDIAATIWFSYTMVFMQNVVGMPSATAGFLLFFG